MGDDRIKIAIDAAHAAGDVLLSHFGGELAIETKSNAIDLVTTADRAAESTIVERLAAATPDFAILGEESGTRAGRPGAPRWVVDPLDGTTNFAHAYPHYSVSIGLIEDGVPVLGVIFDPSRGETFSAVRGQGAWLSDVHGRRPLHVTSIDTLEQSVLATGFGYDRATAKRNNVEEFTKVIARVRGIRRAGSAALDLAWVAAGRLDGYWEYNLAPWDWCAGAVLATEAGADISTIEGDAWTIDSQSVCVAAPSLLATLREALGA